MSVPRITLWTNSFNMPLRMSVCTFDEVSLDKQVSDIQNLSPRLIEISPGALYILSSVVGRRMTESVRWILFDSLRDILEGHLRTLYPEKQDLLASTFGELLGAVLLAIQLGGMVEVVRLLESKHGKTPDFILLQIGPGGQTAHVLECKGRVEDVNNINDRSTEFDLCSELRSFRKEAVAQVDKIVPSPRTGSRTIIRQKELLFDLSSHAATKNVLISSVPDGRITRRCNPHAGFARRKQCQPSGMTCKVCMTSEQDPTQANVICVLYQKKEDGSGELGADLSHFIEGYRTVQRAIWSGNDSFFEMSLKNLIGQLTGRSIQNALSAAVFMLITLIETATSQELTHADFDIDELVSIAPEELRPILKQVSGEFFKARQFNQKGIQRTEIPNYDKNIRPFPIFDPEQIPSTDIDNNRQREATEDRTSDTFRLETQPWYVDDPGVNRAADFARVFSMEKLIFGGTLQDDTIYGSVEHEDRSTAIIRLASLTMNDEALQAYAQGLIARLRYENAKPVTWREEYFKEDGRGQYLVGKSWDEYPYPHPTNEGLLGLTAWLAEDGRAEIIVRRLR